MKRWSAIVLASAAITLELLPVAVAHGDHGGDEVSASPDAPAAHMEQSPNYFRHPEHGKAVLAHIALMTISWAFVLPIGKQSANKQDE